jgi:hypothetical protein
MEANRMKCTTCNEKVRDALQLELGYGLKKFCSFECLIEYSVAQLLNRWRGQINQGVEAGPRGQGAERVPAGVWTPGGSA